MNFYQLLVGARRRWLTDALVSTLAQVPIADIQADLAVHAPAAARQALASTAIRDEFIFPTPCVLVANPSLVGYYRLLLGLSQKGFYTAQTGMAPFKTMESKGTISASQRAMLPAFCSEMGRVLGDLIIQAGPSLTVRDVEDLQVLTLGPQFRGSNNNVIGQQAIADVFLAIQQIAGTAITDYSATMIDVAGRTGRAFKITLASDPDVTIQEHAGNASTNVLAIEVKGGTDASNAYNRGGEAEKSHAKARLDGYRECWTVIKIRGVQFSRLRQGSPTTNAWFEVAEIVGQTGPDWEHFKRRMQVILDLV